MAVLRRTAHWRGRGPAPLPLLVLLTLPNAVVGVVNGCGRRDYSNLAEPLTVARFALSSARTLPLLAYLLAYAFPGRSPDSDFALYVNDMDGAPLLTVSPQQPDTGCMVAEDGSGWLSRLFYLWMSPLLQRGQQGELDKPSDVYHLPRKLRTSVVCRHFRRCWEACQQGAPVQDPWPAPVSGGSLQSGSWSSGHMHHPQEAEEVLELRGDVRLLKVLHKAFGLRFYLLGALKLMVNVLSFAGPLLLSSLVNFMEDKTAALATGAWCAAGLFATTFFACIFRNVYVFETSKVALSARAALVSAIYSKALQVSGSSLAGFSLGELVNLMSTDADRVVNFCNSFHELWSLPFRFAVALYLMYLQVGVAFLGGLSVALLLVPFNKFLASRILSNNEKMLRCKDSRVKVRAQLTVIIRFSSFQRTTLLQNKNEFRKFSHQSKTRGQCKSGTK